MHPRHVLLAAVVAFAVCSPADAKNDKGWGPPPAKAAKAEQVEHVKIKKVKKAKPQFSSDDAAYLRLYFSGQPQPQPAAWTALPPGIAKNYARGKPLPPGIAKKLPQGALAGLPLRPGYEYVVVGRDVVLIEAASRIVIDIIERIFD